mmetsp:Transcript_40304/g.104470  ORF Transcript_40304/g.104470 Transcript_40304/m.104470 type:complete len:481 (+) Transcript_40304:3099-4541(+)
MAKSRRSLPFALNEGKQKRSVLDKIRSFFARIFSRKQPPKRVVILGPAGVGKSTVCRQLEYISLPKSGQPVSPPHTEPTRGLDYAQAKVGKRRSVEVVDMSGTEAIQPLWPNYMSEAECILFVLDSTDDDSLAEAREALLKYVILSRDAAGKSVLIVANNAGGGEGKNEAEVEQWLWQICQSLPVHTGRHRTQSVPDRLGLAALPAVEQLGSSQRIDGEEKKEMGGRQSNSRFGMNDANEESGRRQNAGRHRRHSIIGGPLTHHLSEPLPASNEASREESIGMDNAGRERVKYPPLSDVNVVHEAMRWFQAGMWDVISVDALDGDGIEFVHKWVKDNTSRHRKKRVSKLKKVQAKRISVLISDSRGNSIDQTYPSSSTSRYSPLTFPSSVSSLSHRREIKVSVPAADELKHAHDFEHTPSPSFSRSFVRGKSARYSRMGGVEGASNIGDEAVGARTRRGTGGEVENMQARGGEKWRERFY